MDDAIKAALEAPLSTRNVKQRTQAGVTLHYIEGWHAIAEANRIFGFDGWERETVQIDMVREPEKVNNNWRVGYMAKVRVRALGITREGTGYGSGIAKDLGDAIESALKEAETDAMKRALMTFGNPFGLALYDKSRANVATETDGFTPVTLPRKSKQDSRDLYDRLQTDVRSCVSAFEVESLMKSDEMIGDLESLPAEWETKLRQQAAQVYRDHKRLEKSGATVPPNFDDLPSDTQDALRNAGTL